MKKTLFFILLTSILILGCSENDGPTGNNEEVDPPLLAETFDLQLTLPDSTELIQFISEDVDYNGTIVEGYSLEQFITEAEVNAFLGEDDFDTRVLFAIQIVADDDYSPRNGDFGDFGDLLWNQYLTGYLLPSEKGRSYFADDNIESAFDVKYATLLNLYRKIDVFLDGNIATFEIGAFTTTTITYTKEGEPYTEEAIALTDFISDYVTNELEAFEFQFNAADGWINDDSNNIFSWNTLENSYWLPERNKAVFLNADMETIFKSVKHLEDIDLVEIQR